MKEIRVEKLALLTVISRRGIWVVSGMLDRGCFTAVFWKIKVLPPISRMPSRVVPTPAENLWFRKLTWWEGFTAVFYSTGVFFNQLSCFLVIVSPSDRILRPLPPIPNRNWEQLIIIFRGKHAYFGPTFSVS